MNLRYLPSEKEIRLSARTARYASMARVLNAKTFPGYRNLDRVETNTVRGGMALVLAEGLALKAPKGPEKRQKDENGRVGLARRTD